MVPISQASGAVPRPIRVASRTARLSDKIKMEPPGKFQGTAFILIAPKD